MNQVPLRPATGQPQLAAHLDLVAEVAPARRRDHRDEERAARFVDELDTV